MSRRRGLRARTVAATAGLALASVALVAGGAAAAPANDKPRPGDVEVQLLAFNDYHGHLESGTPGTIGTTAAGGAEFLATHLAQLREGHRNSVTVAAGDLIGGSPFLSGLFHDEPSVESLNALGLDVSGVGNHEFDEGVTELLRMQNGGCHPVDGCYFPDAPYAGADFQWLAANVRNDQTGKTPLPPYWVQKFQGAKVGFIGMTLEGTDALVAQSGIQGWKFRDEVETANALVPELKKQGVEAIVVLLHEGGAQTGTYDQCAGISGPVVDIAKNLDPEIDVLLTGHTHQAYNCSIPDPDGVPRRVTSAASFGRVVSEINLTISRTTGDVRRDTVTATNHVVTQDVARAPEQTRIIDKWKGLADTVGSSEVGRITADIRRQYEAGGSDNRGAESDLGNMIADSQLRATQANGAQIALMNPGGLRADLLYARSGAETTDGVVTYAEAFNVQPFGNLLSTIPMTGDQLHRILLQQCQPRYLHLGVSAGFTYDVSRQLDGRVCTPGSIEVTNMRLNGVPIDPAATYMVTVNNFLVDGGDGFTVFREIDPALRVGAGIDLDALNAYLRTQGPIAPPGTDRVNELA
ncbi:bifunctional metallophosphatase/5'-nucleotidase [Georgenia thermotolerans]|uniref:Bifunctional metallophosphatase/5'-nucleotidase n=1 Tax=Georgenia thermotolerans TaxID=527326 RepID=A0A7J5UQY2_9MICO|nr:bifunctional metallophosphatase/5'-nucleotidase [Georgenia thermotolerans]KAE8764621.1 bifunctional metallophosphatase/5'-nucleotidase [Georgenia thermotolerans]